MDGNRLTAKTWRKIDLGLHISTIIIFLKRAKGKTKLACMKRFMRLEDMAVVCHERNKQRIVVFAHVIGRQTCVSRLINIACLTMIERNLETYVL